MDRLKFLLLAGLLALVVAAIAAGPASAKGGNTDNVKRCQNGGWANLYDANTGLRFINQGGCVSYGARGRAYAGFELNSQPFGCNIGKGGSIFSCFWGSVSGFGLAPNAPIRVSSSAGPVTGLTFPTTTDANGNVNVELDVPCDLSITGYNAITTTPSGATITSNTVDGPGVPCIP